MNVGLYTLVGSLAVGVAPDPQAPHPPLVPAPVLAAKVIAPAGVRVTAYPGTPLARLADAPAVYGLRPGYSYRFELSNLPYRPGRVLYPEVEVRGVLVPRNGLRYMDWPAPLQFSGADIDRALAGGVVTKVIYLEDPAKAIPAEVPLTGPVELTADTEEEAVRQAVGNGRLIAIVRLGNKVPPPEYLRATAIDGTVLLPGEGHLKAPAVPPTVPYYAVKLFDPILGPKFPDEECFPDGGDTRDPLGIGPGGLLGGLNPTDVGVEYTTPDRRGLPARRVTTSNVVCLCVPRFVARRVEVTPGGLNVPLSLAANNGAVGLGAARERFAAMAQIGREKAVGVVGAERPMAYVGRVGTAFFVGSSRPSVIGQVEGVAVTAAVVEPEVLNAYPTLCPLTVTKTVDPASGVKAGDVVTFTIRFVNTGAKPVSDLIVSDSLSGRLEYVEGSQQSDRAANFSASANEAGSQVVRWELPGTLLPGQGGVVKFRARVR